jgi:uncharacterized protein (DUF2235 family)
MSKRLIVFCDGTWNAADEPTKTNVCKLRLAVDESEDAAVPQLVHYEPGVGTKKLERMRGGAFGVGLSRNLRHCYEFLVDNYDPGDELFFFGFSRGAFTARSLAGLVRNSGILRREHRDKVMDAYRLYRNRKAGYAPSEQAAKDFRDAHSHQDIEIAFIGVWDTVGALGIPAGILQPPLLKKRWSFHDTTLSKSVRNAYHAISIDERRRPFAPTLWVHKVAEDKTVLPLPEGQTVSQVWFAGVHSDVGGGYPDPALSEIPLLWMAERAVECGLALKEDHLAIQAESSDEAKRRDGIHLVPDDSCKLHNSMSFFYWLLRPLDRKFTSVDGVPINATVASSIGARCKRDSSYSPPGWLDWPPDNITEVRYQRVAR